MEKKKILLAANAELELVAKIDELSEKTNRSRAGMIVTILKDYFIKKKNQGGIKWANMRGVIYSIYIVIIVERSIIIQEGKLSINALLMPTIWDGE